MSTIYDSRAFVKRLIEAGMPEQQADTLASENLLLIAEHLATKDDFRALEAKLEAKIEALDAKIDLRLAAMESKIIAKVGGIVAAAVAATAAIASIATAIIKLV